MTSRDIRILLEEDPKGEKLYKQYIKYFELVDTWAERFTNGDLLNEYELSEAMDRLTGCLMKFGPVAGALEALKEAKEHDVEVKNYAELEKVRTQDTAIIKATARDSVSRLRKMSTDFRNYFYASQSGVVTAQSRLKRLTVEKGAKKVDYTGEQHIDQNVPLDGWDT